MDISIAKLLTTVYELEGLLLVVNKHGDDTPPEVIEALKGKAQAAHELAQQVQWHTASDSATCSQPSTVTPEAATPAEAEPEDGTCAEATCARNEAEDAQPAECQAENAEPEATCCTPPYPTAAYDEAVCSDEDQAEHCDGSQADESTAAECGDECKECDNAVNTPEEEEEAEEDVDEDIDNDVDEDIDEDEAQDAEEDETGEEELRIDEKLQRTRSKDLRRAFSINDRFRFRRELFANSDIEMRDAINMVECMHSAEEAEDYFYNDLNWEKTSPDVKDFMEIIKNHFA